MIINLGVWEKCTYLSPWFNGQVIRFGVSHPVVQNLTQNLVHKFKNGYAPFFLNYDYMYKGVYSYSGFDNPISLFNF